MNKFPGTKSITSLMNYKEERKDAGKILFISVASIAFGQQVSKQLLLEKKCTLKNKKKKN